MFSISLNLGRKEVTRIRWQQKRYFVVYKTGSRKKRRVGENKKKNEKQTSFYIKDAWWITKKQKYLITYRHLCFQSKSNMQILWKHEKLIIAICHCSEYSETLFGHITLKFMHVSSVFNLFLSSYIVFTTWPKMLEPTY